jgi:hypothetical protein
MKFVLGILVLTILAGPAVALDSDPDEDFRIAVEALLGAVSNKLDDLDGEDLDKAEKKVMKSLGKVEKLGISVDVEIDKGWLKKFGKVLKAVEKAKKYDSGLVAIDSAVANLKTAVDRVLATLAEEAEDAQDDLSTDKYFGKIGKKIDKALGKLDGIDGLWSSRFAKAWKNYVKAALALEKTIETAEKYYDKELSKGGLPAGVSFDSDGRIVNDSGDTLWLNDLIYDLSFNFNGVKQTIKFKATEVTPAGTFPIQLGTGSTGFDPQTYSSVWQNYASLDINIKGKLVYRTSAGDLTLNFK